MTPPPKTVVPYIGEQARIAVQMLNASLDGPPIIADGDGWWLAPRTPTQWDAAMLAPTHLRWSDETVIAQARDMDDRGLLVIPSTLSDNREVRP